MNIGTEIFIGTCLFNMLLISSFKKRHVRDSNKRLIGYCIICLLIILFGWSITPDYTTYADIVKEVVLWGYDSFVSIELFYVWLILKTGGTIWGYKLVLYSISFCLFAVYVNKLNIENKNYLLFLFSILSLYDCIVGRQLILSVVLMFSVLFYSQRKYLLCLLFVLFSFVLHKQAILIVPILILSIILNLQNKNILLILSLIVVSIILINYVLQNYYTVDSELIGSTYLRQESISRSLRWIIVSKLILFIKYSISIMVLYLLYKYKFSSSLDKRMYSFLFWLIIIATAFSLSDINTDVIVSRILIISTFPCSYLLCKLKQQNLLSKKLLLFLKVQLILYIICVELNIYVCALSNIRFN